MYILKCILGNQCFYTKKGCDKMFITALSLLNFIQQSDALHMVSSWEKVNRLNFL